MSIHISGLKKTFFVNCQGQV